MAFRVGSKIQIGRSPLSPIADVFPLVACVTAGCTFAVYKMAEHMMNPDVVSKPSSRSTVPWEREDDHGAWRDRMLKHYRHRDQGPLGVFEPFSARWWQLRAAVRADPSATTKGGYTLHGPEGVKTPHPLEALH